MTIKKYNNNISFFFLSSAICSIFGIVSNMILTRIMSTDIFGFLGLFNSVSAVLVGIMCFGFDNSYIRYFFERPDNDNIDIYSSYVLKVVLHIYIGLSIIILVFWRLFSDLLFHMRVFIFIGLLLINVFSLIIFRFQNIYFRMIGDGRRFAVQSICVQIVPKVLLLVGVFIIDDSRFLIAIMCISMALFCALYLFKYRSVFLLKNKISTNNYFEFRKYAILASPLIIIDSINSWIPQYLIGKYLGLGKLGIYNAALVFPMGINVLKSSFITIWSPYVYKNYKNIDNNFDFINKCISFFSVIFISAVLLLSDFLYLFIGKDFRQDSHLLGFVLIPPLFLILYETTSYGISISNKIYLNSIILGGSLLINFILGEITHGFFGLDGFVIIYAISVFIYYVFSTIISSHFFKMVSSNFRAVFDGGVLLFIAFIFNYFYNERVCFVFIDCVILCIYAVLNKKTIFLLLKKIKQVI